MMDTTRRRTTMAQPVEPRTTQTKGNDGSKKEIWSSMLDSVASGRKLPEKTIFALGPFKTLIGGIVAIVSDKEGEI